MTKEEPWMFLPLWYIPSFTSLHNRIESGGAESCSRSSRPRQAKAGQANRVGSLMLGTLRLYDLHAGQTLFLQSRTARSDDADVQVQCGAGGGEHGEGKAEIRKTCS